MTTPPATSKGPASSLGNNHMTDTLLEVMAAAAEDADDRLERNKIHWSRRDFFRHYMRSALSALEAEGYVVTKKDSSLSPRDAPSDEQINAVSMALCCPNTACRMRSRAGTCCASEKRYDARDAIEAYLNATGGDTRGEANSTPLSAREPIK